MKNNTPSHEEIAARAYQIFVERGCPEGRDLEHWLEAEAQLSAAIQQQAEKTGGVTSKAQRASRPNASRRA